MDAARRRVTPPGEGMAAHLRGAIRLNRERLPLYARLTDGASLPISRALIRAERAALPLAWQVDRGARRWQRAGMRTGWDEWVPMERTPPFRERMEWPLPQLADFRPAPARRIAADLVGALRRGGFAAVERAAAEHIRALEDVPAFHCMLRHLLESAAHVAALAPRHAEEAAARRLPSPERWSARLLRLHALALPFAAWLDRRAAPLQAAGVAILCRDVPRIPS